MRRPWGPFRPIFGAYQKNNRLVSDNYLLAIYNSAVTFPQAHNCQLQNGSASSVHTEKESHIYYLSYYYFVLWRSFFNCWYKATRFLTVITKSAVAPQSIYGNQSHINIKSFIIKFLLSCSMLPFQYPSYQNPWEIGWSQRACDTYCHDNLLLFLHYFLYCSVTVSHNVQAFGRCSQTLSIDGIAC